jgi:hypothetical protein
MAQDTFSSQGLIDLFSIEKKELALKYIEEKGCESYEPEISSPIVLKESTLFFKNSNDSGLSIILDGNRIGGLLYFDSLKKVHRMLDELKNSGWKLSQKSEGAFEVYENKQKDFMISYHMDLEDNTHMIQLKRFKRQ